MRSVSSPVFFSLRTNATSPDTVYSISRESRMYTCICIYMICKSSSNRKFWCLLLWFVEWFVLVSTCAVFWRCRSVVLFRLIVFCVIRLSNWILCLFFNSIGVRTWESLICLFFFLWKIWLNVKFFTKLNYRFDVEFYFCFDRFWKKLEKRGSKTEYSMWMHNCWFNCLQSLWMIRRVFSEIEDPSSWNSLTRLGWTKKISYLF